MDDMNEERKKLQDEFLNLVDNTDEVLTIVHNAEAHPLMPAYLKHLVSRLRKMYQPFSWVEYKKEISHSITFEYFIIHNYSFKSYKWAIDRGFEAYMTDENIRIPLEELNEQEIKQLKEKANE